MSFLPPVIWLRISGHFDPLWHLIFCLSLLFIFVFSRKKKISWCRLTQVIFSFIILSVALIFYIMSPTLPCVQLLMLYELTSMPWSHEETGSVWFHKSVYIRLLTGLKSTSLHVSEHKRCCSFLCRGLWDWYAALTHLQTHLHLYSQSICVCSSVLVGVSFKPGKLTFFFLCSKLWIRHQFNLQCSE